MARGLRKHFSLSDIEIYLRFKKFPNDIPVGNRSNFRRACKKFCIRGGVFLYGNDRLVITERTRQQEIIKDIHEGRTENSTKSSSHKGRDSTMSKISERFFWHAIRNDVQTYIKACEICQKQGDSKLIANEEQLISNEETIPIANEERIHIANEEMILITNEERIPITNEEKLSIVLPPSSATMKQIGLYICSLPEVNEYKYIIICIDYFTKWSEAKPLKDKNATTVARFLCELIYRHGCFGTQINDQETEYVNEVSQELRRLTCLEQRVAGSNYPQLDRLVERQNGTIKNLLIKVLSEHASDWPFIVNRVLFAHRVSWHRCTQSSPFELLYNREPDLPIDIMYQRSHVEDMDSEEPFDKQFFELVLSSTKSTLKGN